MALLRTILCAFFIVTGVMSKPIGLSADECSESTEANSSEEVVAEGNTSQETLQHSGTDVPNAVEPTEPPLTSPDATALPDLGNLLPETSAMPDPGNLLPETSAMPDLGNLLPDTSAMPDLGNLLPDTSAMPDPGNLLPDTSAMPDPGNLLPDTSAMPDLGNPQATDTTALQVMPDDPSQTVLGVDVSQDMFESNPAHDKVNAGAIQVLPEVDLSGTSTKKGQAAIITTYHGYPKGATPPVPPYFSGTTPAGIPITSSFPVCFTFQFTTPDPEPPRGDM